MNYCDMTFKNFNGDILNHNNLKLQGNWYRQCLFIWNFWNIMWPNHHRFFFSTQRRTGSPILRSQSTVLTVSQSSAVRSHNLKNHQWQHSLHLSAIFHHNKWEMAPISSSQFISTRVCMSNFVTDTPKPTHTHTHTHKIWIFMNF